MLMTRRSSLLTATALLGFSALSLSSGAQAQVSLTTLGTPHTQNFDTLLNTGSTTWTNNSTIPGWFHARTGTGTTIVANDGSSNAGNLYSYGTGTAAERALGSLGSGNAAIGNLFWGIRLQNNTGATISALDISYTGEQWRNSAAAAQTAAFSFVVGTPTVTGTLAEFQIAGIAVNQLDFTSPITGGAAGALNGNLAANRATMTFSITGLSIPNGTEVMLRWSDPDHTGADHGLSIDDFSVTPQGAGGTSADLSITKTDSPDPVNAGSNIAYTITATNNGPDPAVTASFSDTLPVGTTFVSLPAVAGWGCTTPAVGAGGTVNCSNPSFAVGSAVFTLTVAVDAGTAGGTIISNTAAITSTTADPTPGNNSATATTTVTAPSADLSITKTDAPDPVTAGNNLTYTITATNSGPDTATTASFSDTLPAGTTFVSLPAVAGWSCTTPAVGAGGTVSCSNPSFVIGSAVFTLTTAVTASTAAGTVLSNTAAITATTTDPTPGNNSATATTTVSASADVSVTKTDAPDPVSPGSNLTYTITASNAGPSDAATVTLSDTLPAGTTFVSLSSPGGWSCTTPAVGATGAVSCSIASLAAGSAVFTLVVNVDAGVTPGTVLSNTATTASATTDPTPGNNSATATTTVGAGSADLSITKTGAPDPVVSGSNLTYTITATNAGPSSAATVALDDTLPAGTTFVSLSSPGGWSCTTPAVGAAGTVSCSIATLAAGSAVFTLIVAVDPAATPGTVLSNTATVSTTTTDPTPGNNSATTTTLVGTGSADLSITKTAAPEPVNAGSNLTYTVTVANAGPSNAITTTMNDTLPAGTTFVSLASPGGWSCTTPAVGASGAASCSNASMAIGNAVFTLVVNVGASVAGGTVIANTATVASAATSDPNQGNESATANSTVSAPSAITGTKTAAGVLTPGGSVTYTITLSNNGASAQGDNPGDEFTDVLPADLTLVSATASSGTAVASIGTNTVTWNGSIPATGSVTITINASINPAVVSGTTILNQGTISFDGDGNGTNESTAVTDNPGTGAQGDATGIVVLGAVTSIPTLGGWMKLLLLAALMMFAAAALRRRAF
jgi:uncharacterized repeat protein (TIGR01451 family)